jgi:hypothetical protein
MEDAKIALIDIGDIAEVAATVLTGSGHEGKTCPLTGPEALGMAEVAEKLSAAAGKPIQYVNVDPEEAKRAQLAAGVPPFLADGLSELFAERRKGKESQVSPIIPTVFGWRPTSFDEFATRHAAIFRGEKAAPKVWQEECTMQPVVLFGVPRCDCIGLAVHNRRDSRHGERDHSIDAGRRVRLCAWSELGDRVSLCAGVAGEQRSDSHSAAQTRPPT